MTTLAKHVIVARAENHPLMLEKSMYDSWESCIHLFIKGKKHGRMMLDSIDNGPLVYLTVEENGQIRPKKYSKLTKAQQHQDDCDVQATNIILYSLPPDVYAPVTHQEAAKDIWDKGETMYEYYWRFSQLINDMYTIRMTMQQVQVNTKFLNAFPLEWSKFVTNVKLAKSFKMTTLAEHIIVAGAENHPLMLEKSMYNSWASFNFYLRKGHVLLRKGHGFQSFNGHKLRFNTTLKVHGFQEKDMVIRKLKDRIKTLGGKDSVENVKKDIDEIEMINIDLEHSVAKLLFENKNLRKE
ncbi:hypothetical protein Tco_1526272 [Tanacetum coccineum]